MMRGFEEDEGFWEVGLHLFLLLLFALPLGLLTSYLARRADVEDHAPAVFGLLIGCPLGEAVIGRLRRKFSRRPAADQPAGPELPFPRQPISLVLLIALPVAALVDRFATVTDSREAVSSMLGLFIGSEFGHWAFHSLRRRYRRAPQA